MANANHQLIFQGYLYKRGHFIKNWNRRYFELYSDGELNYFSSQGGSKKGSYVITNNTVYEDSLLRHFCFLLYDSGPSAVVDKDSALFMAAETTNIKDMWVEALTTVINSARK